MKYKRFDNTIIARIDKGEEILKSLKTIALSEGIKLANINAIGAVNDFTIGVYKVCEKKYYVLRGLLIILGWEGETLQFLISEGVTLWKWNEFSGK